MAFIWKDQFDAHSFHVGGFDKYSSDKSNQTCYAIWFTIFIDAIFDLFDKDTYEWAKKLPAGIPVEINLALKPKAMKVEGEG